MSKLISDRGCSLSDIKIVEVEDYKEGKHVEGIFCNHCGAETVLQDGEKLQTVVARHFGMRTGAIR